MARVKQPSWPSIDQPYSWYVLGVLFLVYALNFIDRQILSILAEDIKIQMHLTDTQLGFLYGTAFAIFYTLFGIPLGRLADSWYRGRLIALGLAVWSAMTAISGFASTFGFLATARIGVGIGEATASPAALSMLADSFSKKRRALAASIYTAGLYLGTGLSLPLGAWIATSWNRTYAKMPPPFGFQGWQVTFLSLGIPGVILALWVLSLREPQRGASEGNVVPLIRPRAWRDFLREMFAIIPPLTLWSVARFPGALAINLKALAIVVVSAGALIALTGDVAQWVGYGVGIYAVFSWIQNLRFTDRPAYALIWGNPMVLTAIFGIGSLSFFTYSFMFWVAPLALRTFVVSKDVVGLYIGLPSAIASAVGVILGGRLSDRWKSRDPRGRVFVCMLGAILPVPFALAMFATRNFDVYCILNPIAYFFTTVWIGSAIATYQDFVLPRMIGTIGATYLLGTTMLGLAIAPYFTGKIAMLTGSLQYGMDALFIVTPVTLALLWIVSCHAQVLEETKFERARMAGEPG